VDDSEFQGGAGGPPGMGGMGGMPGMGGAGGAGGMDMASLMAQMGGGGAGGGEGGMPGGMVRSFFLFPPPPSRFFLTLSLSGLAGWLTASRLSLAFLDIMLHRTSKSSWLRCRPVGLAEPEGCPTCLA
jgi:hypothetical protein